MYNLQALGGIRIDGPQKEIELPGRIGIRVELGPLSAFGAADEPGRTVIVGHLNVSPDPDTGRLNFRPNPPLPPLKAKCENRHGTFELRGNVLVNFADYAHIDELRATVWLLRFSLSPLLNLYFDDPPYVRSIRLHSADSTFHLQHKSFLRAVVPTNWESLCQSVEAACKKTDLLRTSKRLVRALQYYHTACRLRAAGYSDWEFMAEAVLNLAKSLDVLFRTAEGSRDQIRSQLRELGYGDAEIENNFIRISALRNSFDVGHPRLTSFPPEELFKLYDFLATVFLEFRELLSRIIKKIEAGEYVLPADPPELGDSKRDRDWRKIIDDIKTSDT